jgi:shingomyelin synthase
MERWNYSPMTRGHKPTASQESNTLSTMSQASCTTNLSLDDTVVVVTVDQVDQEEVGVSDRNSDRVLPPSYPSPAPLEGRVGQMSVPNTTPSTPLLLPEEHQDICPFNESGNTTVKCLSPPNDFEAGYDSTPMNQTDDIPGEPLKTMLSALFLGTGFLATTVSLALTHERVPEVDPLPDIVLDNVKYQGWGLDVSEILLMLSTMSAVMLVLLHSHRMIILRRIWLLLGILYYYRALTMFVTVLPKADKTYTCMPRSANTTVYTYLQRVMTIISGGGLSINGKHIYCGDYIFSGHTMTLTMGYLAIRQYSPRKWFLLHWTSLSVSTLGVVFLLISRGHYTIDVLLAYYVSSRLWWTYHTLCHTPSLRSRGGHNLMDNLCWWHVFRWFEAKVPPGPLPHSFSIPLPKRMRRIVEDIISRVRGSRSLDLDRRPSAKP